MSSKPISPHDDYWNEEQRACIDCLSEFYGGYHHLDNLRECGKGVMMTTIRDFSTFDNDRLTSLVIAAHARSVRVEISSCSPHYLRVYAHKRVDDPSLRMHLRHPNLSDLMKRIEERKNLKEKGEHNE